MAASWNLLSRSPFSAVFVTCIVLLRLSQMSEGLKCYCDGRHCKGDEANGTCVEEKGGVCFGALAKVYGTSTGKWQYEFFYGCYSGGSKKIALCQNNLIPGMKCCKDRDYCNWSIVPRLPGSSTTAPPAEDNIYKVHPALLFMPASLLVMGVCVVILYYYLKKKKRQNMTTDKNSDGDSEPPVAMSQLTQRNAE